MQIFYVIKFSQPAPWHFFLYRFMMVVRKNVLEYIITRLKKCLKKFQIWQSSIVQINLSITSLCLIPKFSTINVNKFLNWCPRDGSRGAHPAPHKIEKILFFGVKSWFFTRNTPTIFAPPYARRNFF